MNKKHRLGPGSVILLTGASSGIGQAMADMLCRIGCTVYGAARSFAEQSRPFQPGPGSSGQNGLFYPLRLDVTDETACERIISQIIREQGRIDCLVLAAGFGLAGAVEDTCVKEAEGQMVTNLIGVSTILPSVIRQMRIQRQGLIVMIGSVAGVLPIPFQAYYSASKAALQALSLALHDEIKPFGLHCLLVNPGDTSTGFTQSRVLSCRTGPDSAYAGRCSRSLARMAADEQGGHSAQHIARLVIRRMQRSRPPRIYTPTFYYQSIVWLQRLLPLGLTRMLIARIYAR
jgi:short-subunit dehydrogenase